MLDWSSKALHVNGYDEGGRRWRGRGAGGGGISLVPEYIFSPTSLQTSWLNTVLPFSFSFISKQIPYSQRGVLYSNKYISDMVVEGVDITYRKIRNSFNSWSGCCIPSTQAGLELVTVQLEYLFQTWILPFTAFCWDSQELCRLQTWKN